MCTNEGNGIPNDGIVLERVVSSTLWDFKVKEKQCGHALLVFNPLTVH